MVRQQIVVSDNLNAGIAKACFCEPAANRTCTAMAAHYATAILRRGRAARQISEGGTGGVRARNALNPAM